MISMTEMSSIHRERKRERDRQTERETERQTDRERERERMLYWESMSRTGEGEKGEGAMGGGEEEESLFRG